MKLIDETKNRNAPHDADLTDFNFVYRVIEALEGVPTKDKVVFPLPNRNSAFADIECRLHYNDDCKPCGEFFFNLRKQELEMAHTAIVSTIVDKGVLKLHLQIKPNKKLHRSGHRSMTRVLADARATAAAICANYAPGSVGRKVIPIITKQTA